MSEQSDPLAQRRGQAHKPQAAGPTPDAEVCEHGPDHPLLLGQPGRVRPVRHRQREARDTGRVQGGSGAAGQLV